MSYLGNNTNTVPQGHESASINPQPTTAPRIGPATSSLTDPAYQSQPMQVQATNTGMEATAKTGQAVRSGENMLPGAKSMNIMARSANQDAAQTDVPTGFIWGLRGEGDKEQSAQMPTWLKLTLAGGVSYLALRALKIL